MTDPTDALVEAFDALAPDELALRRVRDAALEAYDVSQRPLALEWLDLARERPVSTTLSLAAAAVVIFVATPIGAVLALLGRLA